jgi:hypothetical protein
MVVAIVGEVIGASLLDNASARLARLVAARAELDTLVREQLVDEIGLRGYMATGERSFLEPSVDETPFAVRLHTLRDEVLRAQLPDAARRVDDFDRLRTRWHSEVEIPLLADPQRSDSLAKQRRAKDLLSAMRSDAKDARDILDGAQTDVARRLRWRVTLTVGVSIGTITLFAIGAIVLGRSRREAVVALAREQSLVAALQQTLRVDGVVLPRTAVGFAYTSATREALIGGDLIDTWKADSESGWFLIADVSGKGIEAARISAFVQYAIRALSAEYAEPNLVLERFNRLFLDTFENPSGFVVAMLGRFDAPTGRLRYASAGHAIAYVVRADEIEQLGPTGSIIGLDRAETYGQNSLVLQPGETVVVATDGLTECRDATGAMLGDGGVIALLRGAADEPQAICDRLVSEVQRRTGGEVSDDLAIFVLRVLVADIGTPPVTFSTLHA